MAVIHAGPGRRVDTLAAAIAEALPHDEIRLDAGIYANTEVVVDFPLRIRGWGGIPVLISPPLLPGRNAILWTKADVSVEGIEFQGAAGILGNAAGIRHELGALKISRCVFRSNQNGVLLAHFSNISAELSQCSFLQNGGGCGHTHAIYACEDVDSLIVSGCRFQNTIVGHHIKSRARRTEVIQNLFGDTPSGTTSYAIDVANGGDANIAQNLIVKGVRSQSAKMISFGSEGLRGDGHIFRISHNIFINHRRGPAVAIANYTLKVPALLDRNGFEGCVIPLIGRGRTTRTKNPQAAIAEGPQLPETRPM